MNIFGSRSGIGTSERAKKGGFMSPAWTYGSVSGIAGR